jgi:uncharacterized 2Fe-2S/4Fe-4S cluster protein (DUF4445 family)
MKKFQVIFLPSGRRGEVPEGKTVIEASMELGVGIESVCGGKRSCGKCAGRSEWKRTRSRETWNTSN